MKKNLNITENKLLEMYNDKEMSLQDIGNFYGCSRINI